MVKSQVYKSPAVEVVEIELESHCFSVSSGNGLGAGNDWPGFDHSGGYGDGLGTGSDWPNFN